MLWVVFFSDLPCSVTNGEGRGSAEIRSPPHRKHPLPFIYFCLYHNLGGGGLSASKEKLAKAQ